MSKDLVTLGSFEFLADVQIIKGRLEAEGIEVVLKDANTVSVEPFASNALGGIKLQVYSSDRERAQTIFNEVRNYAVDENGVLIKCPNCGQRKSETHYLRNTIFYKLFPFFEPKKYRCTQCNFITRPHQ
ncbi:putative signal transducing protein [Flagellimonas sp. 2504JD4-2]